MTISEIVSAQKAFYKTGTTRSLEFRLKALKRLQSALRENESLLADALKKDLNKAPMETYMCETGLVLDEIRYHLRHLAGWMKDVADICVKAKDEEGLPKYEKDLEKIHAEVKKLALKFPVPAI